MQQNKKSENFKKKLLRSKRFEKSSNKRIRPNDLIKKTAKNMNETISTKYQLAPETIEKQSLNRNDGKYFKKYMTLWEYKKLKIIKWETINITKKLIEKNEN